jgi:hypothetical protein
LNISDAAAAQACIRFTTSAAYRWIQPVQAQPK